MVEKKDFGKGEEVISLLWALVKVMAVFSAVLAALVFLWAR